MEEQAAGRKQSLAEKLLLWTDLARKVAIPMLVALLALFSYLFVERNYEKARIQQLESDLKSAQMNCEARSQAYEKMLQERQVALEQEQLVHVIEIRIYELERQHPGAFRIINIKRNIAR